MICPRTKGNCGCNSAADCMLAPVAVAVGPFNLFTSPPPPILAELFSVREDGSLVIDPSVTSFSVQPSSDGWTIEQVSLSNGDIVECGPLVGKTLVDVPGDVAPFVMRDLTKPTLADIERLVDAYGDSCDAVLLFEGLKHTKDKLTAKAALMAAIRLYGME